MGAWAYTRAARTISPLGPMIIGSVVVGMGVAQAFRLRPAIYRHR